MLPLTVAVIASRSCEVEHRGNTFKLLETAATPGRLYGAKLGWGAVVLGGLLALRAVLFAALGAYIGFAGAIPWGRAAVFHCRKLGGFVHAVCATAGAFPSLRQPSIGTGWRHFRKLFWRHVLLFPVTLQRCAPWGYYGLMALAGMLWGRNYARRFVLLALATSVGYSATVCLDSNFCCGRANDVRP